MRVRRLLLTLFAAALFPAASPGQTAARTLDQVRARGVLHCGIIREDAEYSIDDDHGSRRSFDDDLCKAFAIAALGKNAAVKTTTFLDSASAMQALRAASVDVIASLSADFTHSTAPGIRLSRPVLFDAVGLLVPRRLNIQHAAQLSGRKVCFLSETAVETDVHAWFAGHALDLVAFPFQEQGEMEAAFATGNCAALAGDATRLANTRAEFGKSAALYLLLPDSLAQDPLAAATRASDPAWSNIVNWVIECLISAEQAGLSSSAASSLPPQPQPLAIATPAARLLGLTHDLGAPLGLPDTWFVPVLAAVGNYGDIYARAFGPASGHEIPRGLNRLVSAGGALVPLPTK